MLKKVLLNFLMATNFKLKYHLIKNTKNSKIDLYLINIDS